MTIGRAVIRPLLDSVEGMPVHVRQLAEMFRKHGRQQRHTTGRVDDLDATDVPEALRDGWKGDWTPNDVVNAGKGGRPDPSDYLDADYVQQHVDRFKDGASRIYFSDSLHRWGPGNQGTTFVFPTSELRDIIDESGGDARAVALRLGLDADDFFDANGDVAQLEVRHFSPDELDGLRVPSGNEGGANESWIPGGYLPTGIPEAVIDVPGSATGIGDVLNGPGSDYNPGLWPGTAEGLTLR